MSRRYYKKKILALLANNEWPAISVEMSEYNHRDVINHLFTSLCSTDETCKWHGVSCFGLVVPQMAEENVESARIIMRRFLWCLNDESGGIGWGIPEAMAEVITHHDVLFEEYCHMILSYMREDGPGVFADGNYLELPALQQGLLWGIGRLIEQRADQMIARGVRQNLPQYLDSPNKIVQGMAIRCLGMCGMGKDIEKLKQFTHSSFTFNLYQSHTLNPVCVGELARHAIQMIENNYRR